MTRIAIGAFEDEGPFVRARLRAITAGRRILGEWTPFACDSLAGGEGAGGIRTGVVLAGLAGAAALFALTMWSATVAYRFNAGGRPLLSWPTFLLSPIEFGALAAAIGGVVVFFRRAGLTRLHHPAFDLDEVGRASGGAFVLALGCDAGEDANAAMALLAEATHARVIGP